MIDTACKEDPAHFGMPPIPNHYRCGRFEVDDLIFFEAFNSTADKRGWSGALDLYIRIRDIIILNGAKDRYFF